MYAITGASGQLGRLVIDTLLAKVPANQIVAAVRSPEKVRDLAARGVVVREADYDRPQTLTSAFAGVDKVLLISSTEVTGRLPKHRAVIDAAKEAGVALLAYTSMLHADHSSAMLAREHHQTELAIAASGVPAVILRNGWYLENPLTALKAALQHGAFIGSAGAGRFSSAARKDYAEAAAWALTSPGQAGKLYELAGDTSFTLAQLASEVSRQSGKTIAYKDLPPADFADALVTAGLARDLAALLADADVAASQGALFDQGHALQRMIGRPTTPLAAAVESALRAYCTASPEPPGQRHEDSAPSTCESRFAGQ
jgi:NAD(P)H dehydrogenase (quinone)